MTWFTRLFTPKSQPQPSCGDANTLDYLKDGAWTCTSCRGVFPSLAAANGHAVGWELAS